MPITWSSKFRMVAGSGVFAVTVYLTPAILAFQRRGRQLGPVSA
jgi:hypothetical protein